MLQVDSLISECLCSLSVVQPRSQINHCRRTQQPLQQYWLTFTSLWILNSVWVRHVFQVLFLLNVCYHFKCTTNSNQTTWTVCQTVFIISTLSLKIETSHTGASSSSNKTNYAVCFIVVMWDLISCPHDHRETQSLHAAVHQRIQKPAIQPKSILTFSRNMWVVFVWAQLPQC